MTKVVHDTDIGTGLEIAGGKVNVAATQATDLELSDSAKALRKLGTHLRLSKNAVLTANAAGTAPEGWGMGDIYSAVIEDTVINGSAPASRSALANEFLDAIKSNTHYFGGNFNIWRMKIRVPTGASGAMPLYQVANTSCGETTLGCVFKHISGMTPKGAMFNGASVTPAKAELILNRNAVWSGGRHHSYSMMHGYFYGNPGDEAEFLIALPAIVTGYVDHEDGWGNFPYLSQSEA
jgi:hypothetical protein